jgi:diaminohydroxyphosphoribosylaminopyrimidine deaminase / 5-amino-6-(5-phosphoribosylamino)uracil reductase
MNLPDTITITEQQPVSEMDQHLMARALNLAQRGTGLVSPGPLVGCVIASPDGEIAGEGFYRYEQLKHAETYALEQAGSRANGATAYVSLEPHAHHGRTPPCTDALIAAGIKRVVAPIDDPNPSVSGKGFAHLRAANLEVLVGVLKQRAEQVNEKYFHLMRTGRPFVHLKFATSLDGKIATRTGDSRWITGDAARRRVHELRHEYDAILIGAGTAIKDQPLLTDRSGKPRRLPLVRVLLDEHLSIPTDSQLVNTAGETPLMVFCGNSADPSKTGQLASKGVEIVTSSGGPKDLPALLEELGKREIQSVLIEGGSRVAGSFMDAGLVDKISVFIAPTVIGGCNAPNAIGGEGAEFLADAFDLDRVEIVRHAKDLEVTGYPRRRMKN